MLRAQLYIYIHREDFSIQIVTAILTKAIPSYDWISNCLTSVIDIALNRVIKMREQQLIAFYILL